MKPRHIISFLPPGDSSAAQIMESDLDGPITSSASLRRLGGFRRQVKSPGGPDSGWGCTMLFTVWATILPYVIASKRDWTAIRLEVAKLRLWCIYQFWTRWLSLTFWLKLPDFSENKFFWSVPLPNKKIWTDDQAEQLKNCDILIQLLENPIE